MSWWRRVFLGEASERPGVDVAVSTRQSWTEPKRGDQAHGKTYLPGGPAGDPTPQYEGDMPPAGFEHRDPEFGMDCTVTGGGLHRRGRIIFATKKRVTVRVEYSRRPWVFTKRLSGVWMEEGTRADGPRLIAGIALSNFKSKKLWYTAADIAGGWKIEEKG